MKKNINNLIILMGLPCSGKTTWAKEQVSKDKNIIHLDFDELIYRQKKYNTILKAIKKETFNLFNDNNINNLIYDFMFYKESDIINILKLLNVVNIDVNNVFIHYWHKNEEELLKRNAIRKNITGIDSTRSITRSIFQKPDIDILKTYKDINIKLIEHYIV